MGSERIDCVHWEELKALWGGSAATVAIINAVISTQAGQDEEDFGSEEEVISANEEEDVIETPCDKESEEPMEKPKSLYPTPTFVDNKRKNMEMSLSASQRDQVCLNMEKKELKLKQNIVDQLATATRESNNAIEKISQSIESVGKSISDGLFALAGALKGPPTPFQVQQPYPQQQQYFYQPPTQPPVPHYNTPSSSSSSFGSPQNENSMTYENL